ncbi:MAG: hypothetical protein ABIR70_11420 [Bryobacteraceae bacterium]
MWILSCGLLAAESRFGLPVASLETPRSFRFLELTDNKFAVSEKSDVVVATTVYGGPWRYFVDVAVNNHSNQTIQLADDFVRFHKNGTAVAATDTRLIVAELQKGLEQTKTVAARAVSPASFGTAALRERALAEQERKDRESLVLHGKTFAHENQSLTLAPGKMTMYTFVFNAPDREKMDFELCVWAGDAEFKYEYKK